MTDKPLSPTDEQTHILDLVTKSSDNIIINALAGTGKTATLEMIQKVCKEKPVLYICFNKRIADEAEEKFPSTTQVRTLNSLGHRVWARSININITLSKKKTSDIYRAIIDEVDSRPTQRTMWDAMWEVVAGVGMAKAYGYIPEGKFVQAKRLITREEFHAKLDPPPDEFVASLIDEVLFRSIKAAYKGNIDFNDQVYMPALFGGTFPKFPLVKVDEFQDLNAVNHAMLDKLIKLRGICVGDPWQSIYGFRGAVRSGMARAKERFSMTETGLSVSFRCPEKVVEAARWRVPHFKWVKPGGKVGKLIELNGYDIPEDATFICRNNAPLFHLAMQLLMHHRSVSVDGSEIGPKVLGIMKKLGDEDDSKEMTLGKIDSWLAEMVGKGSTTAHDTAACMKVFATFGETLGQALIYAEHLFKQKGSIRLLTGHKAKGLEFDNVYFLDSWLLDEDDQDLNLRYVIQTRSKDRLYYIDSTQIRW